MKIKNHIAMLLIVIFFLAATNSIYAAPTVLAPNAILLDYETGEVLFEKNGYEVTYPASTTKVMTAVLVLENANLDDVITIDNDLYVDGASMYLLKGESFTVKELFQALLVRSANDAAEVLAVHISGSIEAFADLMNSRAKELGAKNTNFTNPHGLPDKNHVTTAYDLAMITKHAMSFPLFRETVGTVMLTFDETEQTPEKRYYRNTNQFLWASGTYMDYNGKTISVKYDIVDGVKTGYTSDAQNCLITSAVKDNHRLISVVLGAAGRNVYSDSRYLLDYGFDNFSSYPIVDSQQFEAEVPVKNGLADSVELVTANSLTAVIQKSQDPAQITKEVLINENIAAPIEQGAVLGKIIYTLGERVLGEVDLIAKELIDAKPALLKGKGLGRVIILLLILLVVWQMFIAYLRFNKKRRRYMYGGTRNSYQFSKNIARRR